MKFLPLLLLFCCVFDLLGQDSLQISAIPTAGFYKRGTAVQLRSNQSRAVIYYTTNGTTPSMSSKRYQGAILIDSTTVLRAVAYNVQNKRSAILTNTYLIDEDSIDLPVVAITIQPAILFDPVRGIFKRGPKASPRFPHKGANYYTRKEYPCHVEFFETDKQRVFHSPVGFKIFGGMSRIFPQKSFSLYASKSRYGNKYLRHQIFPQKDQKKFKRIVMRNSGSDFGETHFRDALITSFGKDIGLEVQAYRPSVVFINGEYWGIYNFREKLTRHYLVENFGYHKDSVNLIEHRKSVQAGSRKTYDAMRTFMRNNSLANQENFDYIGTQMDIENFMEYQILQIYIDNQDAGGNIKFWRPKKQGGRWRWILFDTDFGLGHYGRNGYKNNSLEFHTKPNGPNWPNPPWSTLNLRSLLQNKGFQDRFINRFLDRLNYTFDSTNIISRIDEMAAVILPALPRHWERWDLSPKRWHKEVNRMKEFSKKRPAFMRTFLQNRFPRVGNEVRLKVQVDSNGTVALNEVIPIKKRFEGIYFSKLPVSAQAKPHFGSRFSHWELDGERLEGYRLELRFTDTIHVLKAIFVKGEHPAYQQCIINEVSCGDTLSGDWIEFYNNSDKDLLLEGWRLKTNDKENFYFPDIVLKKQQYLVVCKDEKRFKRAFPSCKNYIAGLPFGLSKKREKIRLYDQDDLPVDRFKYDFSADSIERPHVIALKDFTSDNEDLSYWNQHQRSGSPASVNPDYIQLQKEKEWQRFLHYAKIGGITASIFILIILSYVKVAKRLRPRKMKR